MSNPSLEWERLQDVFYRSRRCFDITWNDNDNVESSDQETSFHSEVNLSNSIVAVSSFATCIALFSKKHTGLTNKSIDVYSGSGVKILSIPWLASNGEIVNLIWTESFNLIVVLANGIFRNYFNLNGDFNEFNDILKDGDIKFDAENEYILDCKPLGNGFVARTSKGKFIGVLADSETSNRIIQFPKIPEEQRNSIFGWSVISGPNRPLKLIVSTDSSLLSFQALNAFPETIKLPDGLVGPFEFISETPNSDFISLYSHSGKNVYIATSDFQHLLSTFKSDISVKPLQLEWCSNDAVILAYKDEIKVIGPSDESLNYYLDSYVYLKPEDDGIYFLSDEHLEYFSRVNDNTIGLFKIGSTSPGAILLDAIDYIDNHSPKANENLSIIKDNLVEAIDNCIRGSLEEFDTYWQKKLLRAAVFGKNSIELYNSDEFVETCNNLRILNVLRQPEIGIFLTNSQLQEIGIDALINLLLFRKLHFLALKVSQFLELPQDHIFIDWACSKIKVSTELPDDELFAIISKKLVDSGKDKTISYSAIAKIAYEEGRIPLSIKLINFEPDTSKQIPLLLEMEEDQFAVVKSEENLDTDSSLFILITLLNKLSTSDFFKILNKNPNTISLFKSKIASRDKELMSGFYYQDDSIYGMSLMELDNLASEAHDDQKQKKTIKKVSSILSRSKATDIYGTLLKQTSKLVETHSKYDDGMEHSFDISNESILDLVDQIISNTGDVKSVLNLESKFKLNERQIYWKVVKRLSQIPERREQLYEFANMKKSPIGYEPFYLECLKNNDKRQASIYVDMCTNLNYKQRVKMYLRCGDFKKAVEEAYKKKDINLLNIIEPLTDNSVVLRMISDYRESLTGRR